MKLIAECAEKLARLGENLWGKEQKLGKAEPLDVPTMTTEFIKENGGLPCPDGYIFKDENGNVIEATKIVLEKKSKYPQTYEECCKVLNYCCNPYSVKTTHKEELIRKFQFLLLYRDSYWKLAGDWKPNWAMYSGPKHCIIYSDNEIKWQGKHFVTEAKVLAFPTEEMRDAFYENFKGLIEKCKEIL